MRVTNTMMRNNSLLNMQKNKAAYNKYLQQYTTQKKIQRPSDDPTIAVRALKYRTTLVEIDQYLVNIKDATSWMDATETVLKDVDSVLQNMIEYFTQAANGTYESKERADIVSNLKQYSHYIYEQDANSDYAGRYLFTGYRTDVPMLFDEAQDHVTYTITENLDVGNIRRYQYVYGGAEYDPAKDADDYAQAASKFETTHRIMISYDNCDEKNIALTYKDKDGNLQTLNPIMKKIGDDTVYNEHLHPGENEVFYIPETGEILFGDKVYDSVRAGSGLTAVYDKTSFEEKDVRPQHYFKCETKDNNTGETAKYTNAGEQTLNYQINFSQTLTINTEGCNAISMSTQRCIDDITNLCNQIDIMEKNLASVEKRISDCDEGDTTTLANLNELKEQISTQIKLQKTVMTNTLSAGITVCQESQQFLNIAWADHGSRENRMKMTKNKLEVQRIDTDEAKSENENADLGDAYVHFTEADLLYQATLGATSKILGQSLLNFI